MNWFPLKQIESIIAARQCVDGVYLADDGAECLAIKQIEREYGFTRTQLQNWNRACCHLEADQLCAVMIPGAGGRRGYKRTYRRQDLDAIRENKLASDAERRRAATAAEKIASGIPGLTEIEANGEWVSALNNPFGFKKDLLHYWRRRGCPYLPGRKLRSKQVIARIDGQPGPRRVTLFHRPTLARIAATHRIDRTPRNKPYGAYSQHWTSGATKAQWRASERFKDEEGTWVSHRIAKAYLRISATELHRWKQYGCLFLDCRIPLTKPCELFGRQVDFWLERELMEIKKKRNSVVSAPTSRDLLTIEEAASILGLAVDTLRTTRRKRGFTTCHILARQKSGNVYRKPMLRRDEVEALARAVTASQSSIAMPSANRESSSDGQTIQPTPPEPYPVYIVNSSACPVPVSIAAAASDQEMKRPHTASLPDGWYGARDLARKLGLSEDAVAKRLERWLNDHPEESGRGWMEAQDPGPNDPRYLFKYGRVKAKLT